MNDFLILALNCGSSSLKFSLYKYVSFSEKLERMLFGEVESIGQSQGKFSAKDSLYQPLVSRSDYFSNHEVALSTILTLLTELNFPLPKAIGHRVVHGGAYLKHHCLIDNYVLEQIKAASSLAPLHNEPTLLVIDAMGKRLPDVPQVACFDTVFHREMPLVARTLAIPKNLQSEGLQRYGFHGLSCEAILYQLHHSLGQTFPQKLVIAHLGNGASITAVKNTRSIDTSMGLTPTGGIIMGTRSGDMDPGLLIYLLREKKYDAASLEDLFNHHSGLKGISGVSHDMRQLHAVKKTHADADLAVQMFCYAVQKQIAAMVCALNGIDMLVFTGGIGQNDSEVRASICSGLAWIGINLDQVKNRLNSTSNESGLPMHENAIHGETSPCAIYVIGSNEETQIARHTLTLLNYKVN